MWPAGDDDYYNGEEDAAELTEEGQAQLDRLDGLLQAGNDDGDNFDDEPQIGNRATNNGTRGKRHIFSLTKQRSPSNVISLKLL